MFPVQTADAHKVTVQALRDAESLAVKKLFFSLTAPPMEVLSGDYHAELLDQGSRFANSVIRLAFASGGNWVGKGFEPHDAKTGVGYNCFMSRGSQIRKLPMRTELRRSELDDLESLTLNYQHDNFGLIRFLTGEVRQVSPHIMLGIGVYQIKLGRFRSKRRLIPFLLFEPHADDQPEASTLHVHSPSIGQSGPPARGRRKSRREETALSGV
jgi:hypothetical protein